MLVKETAISSQGHGQASPAQQLLVATSNRFALQLPLPSLPPLACPSLLVLCAHTQVYVWDLKPQQQVGAPTSVAAAAAALTAQPVVRQLRHHKEPVVAAAWSSNCCQLVTADKGGNLAFWQCIET